jgi:hypothetical protein
LLANWNTLDAYTTRADAVPLETTLYFRSLNVPTRPFNAGFPLFNGGFLRDASNNTLIEFFRMDFDGFLELSDIDEEGEYEIATIADDGVRVQMGLEQVAIINQPAVTASRFTCATQKVNMVRGMAQPLHVSYFQGPKYHIALMMMWRKASPAAEPLCNANNVGNELFFNSNVYDEATHTPSDPQPAFRALEGRAWSVIKPVNYRLPDSELFNPCLSERVKKYFGWE